jgi:chromate reductase
MGPVGSGEPSNADDVVALDVVALVGSLRPESWNRRVLELAATIAPSVLRLDLVGLGGVPLFDDSVDHRDPPRPVADLKHRIARCDAVLLSTPEYNLGISGVVKNALDWLSCPTLEGPLLDKPIAILSASTSRAEPERAVEQARLTVEVCGAAVMPPPDLTIRSISRRFDADTGEFADTVVGPLTEHLERFAEFATGRRSA